jgi:hypothetical protein
MENGSIAEARAKAFLMDRFWILERSVDVDGADLFIQRRLTSKTLLNKEPVRLGVVQVKFFSDAGTTQYVHREYVVDSDGKPRGEFFLICHTGVEGNTRSFFLTSEDIANEDEFAVAAQGHSHEGKYKIPGSKVLALPSKFEIVAPKLVLDRIERALQKADFAANRRFLSWALPDAQDAGIDVKYMEPIDTDWGDIPIAVKKLKERATEGLYALEEVYKQLIKIIESTNPDEMLNIAEEVDSEGGGRRSDKNEVRFPALWDEDLFHAVQRHEKMHHILREAGLLDQFILLRKSLIEFVCSEIAPSMPLSGKIVHVIDVRYDPSSFELHNLASTICTMIQLEGQPNTAPTLQVQIIADGPTRLQGSVGNEASGTTRTGIVQPIPACGLPENRELDQSGRQVVATLTLDWPSSFWPADGVLFSKPGMVRIYWRPGGSGYSITLVKGKRVQRAEGAAINWREALEETAPKLVLMDEVFRLRFG